MSQKRSERDQGRQQAAAIAPLPQRAEPGMTRAAQQRLFEQLKTQVHDTASKYFDQSLRVIKTWMGEDKSM